MTIQSGFLKNGGLFVKSTNTLQHKTKEFEFELKASNDEENIIEGYASTFGGDPDSYGDVIEMGAFAKTIKERGRDIKFLWQHDWHKPIGKIIDIYEDAKGLFIKVKISETALGKEALILAKDGVINRMSIGYTVVKDEYDREKGIRYLKEIKLYEVSAVTFPANSNAVITNAKNEEMGQSIKHFIDNTIEEIKAGKVLSAKNKKAVIDAIESLEKAADALQSLLDATDSDEGDKGGGKKPDPDDDGGDDEDEGKKSFDDLLAQFKSEVEMFKK